jgi:hypothetical protein
MATDGLEGIMSRAFSSVLLALAAGACASGQMQRSDDPFDMSGGRYVGASLDKAIAEAAKHKLGTRENPVRAEMPLGQHAYLKRLRCADGKAPKFERAGNLGFGGFGSIVDAYDVRCEGSSPAQATVVMDMYFPDYVETQAVEGFTIVPP